MSVITLEGVIEDGQIRLLSETKLPEGAYVYVVIPAPPVPSRIHVYSPRLVHREQASDFVVEMIEEDDDAEL